MHRFQAVAALLTLALLGGMSSDGCTIDTVVDPIRPPVTIKSSVSADNPRNVSFTMDLTNYPNARTINWNYGDNSSATGLSVNTGRAVTHSYLHAGTFTVKAFVFNEAAQTIADPTLSIMVTGADPTLPPSNGGGGGNTGPVHVRLKTNKGDIVLEMKNINAPGTVANFLSYVDSGHYNNIVFHRVVVGFVIQTGAFRSLGAGADPRLEEIGPNAPINSEANNGLSNIRGTVALALRGSDANSGTDQFFINLVDTNSFLDNGSPPFTVFATVISGMDVADIIANVPVSDANAKNADGSTVPFTDVPTDDVIIQAATRE